MSLFEGLGGVEDALPTLIDEDDLLFGEDLFEFLEEASSADRMHAAPIVPVVPSDPISPAPVAPVIPAASVVLADPVVQSTPEVPVAPAPKIPAAPEIPAAPVDPAAPVEPAGYTTPKFYPFSKSEATTPQLKLSGVSSFKKINSRLVQGSLGVRDEVDAIRELERALSVLGHQKHFLKEQKAGLEKWTSEVYGLNLKTEISAPGDTDAMPSRAHQANTTDAKYESEQDAVDWRIKRREIRVSVKCRGADKRDMDKKLLAQVDYGWCPKQRKADDSRKRASTVAEVEKPTKRTKPMANVEQKVFVPTIVKTINNSIDSEVGQVAEDEPPDDATEAACDVPDTPDQLWKWLESKYFSAPSRKQPLPEDLTLEGEDRLGRTSLVPMRVCAATPKTGSESGDNERFEDNADVLRQRLTSALIVPGVKNSGTTGAIAKPDHSERWTTPRRTNALDVLDVTNLSLNQRVLVQLQGVGLINFTSNSCQTLTPARPSGGAECETHRLQQRLAESIKILNHSRIGLRRGISATP